MEAGGFARGLPGTPKRMPNDCREIF